LHGAGRQRRQSLAELAAGAECHSVGAPQSSLQRCAINRPEAKRRLKSAGTVAEVVVVGKSLPVGGRTARRRREGRGEATKWWEEEAEAAKAGCASR